MKISNDLRRVRQKLKLFEKEGLNELLFDIINETTMRFADNQQNLRELKDIVSTVKKQLLVEEKSLTLPDPKQSKLFE